MLLTLFSALFTTLLLIRYIRLHQRLTGDNPKSGPQKFHIGLAPRVGGGIAVARGLHPLQWAAYLPHILVRMRSGGVSNRSIASRLRAHYNDWKAWQVNGLMPLPWTVFCKPLRKVAQWWVS